MKREIEKLSSEMFDVLIIGGGIHGAAIAREASRQGFKTALIEMNDFGHSTSFNSMKVIHGGLRYLQHGNIKRIRQSVRSRKILQRIAPHLIKAVPFLVPTYGYGIKSKNVMRSALFLNDLISFDRNFKIASEDHIPSGKIINKNEARKILSGINQGNITGGAVWYEAVVQNTERLLLKFLLDAYDYDFTAANYVEAFEFLIQNNQVKGVLAKDLINSNEFNIKAKIIINAVGPWFNLIQKSLKLIEKPEIKLTKAVNIIVKRKIFSSYGVGLEGKQGFVDTDALIRRGKRLFFFVPIKNYTMIGTSYKQYEGEVNDLKITTEDIREIINEVNYINPSLQLTSDDVSFYHVGLVPMDETSDADNIQAERHSAVYNYEKILNLKNLFSVKSVKYTTAPVIAEDVIKMIREKIQPSNVYKKKNKIEKEELSRDIPPEIVKRITRTYGSNSHLIFKLIYSNNSYQNLVSVDPPVTIAEIIHSVRNEMSFTLKDVVLRRTGIGTLKCPSNENITAIASVMSTELGWDKTKENLEIENLLDVYCPVKKYVESEC
jgi:glycerol-3-phosphate dehydrogenase